MSRVSVSFQQTGIDLISFLGRYRLGRVQNASISANLPNTPVQELGSNRLVGRIFDTPEVSVTVSSIDVGARTAFLMANKDWATSLNDTSVALSDFQYVCLAQSFKHQSTNDVVRTLVVPGAKVDSISWNYSVGGDATEDYTLVGSTYTLLRYDAALASGTVDGNSQLTFSPSARQLKNGRYVLTAYNANGYLPPEAITASTATSVTFDPAFVPAESDVLIVYHADLNNQWQYTYEYPNIPPGYTPPPDQPVGVRGWGVEVYLVRQPTSTWQSMRVLRAQSCTIQAQMNSQRIQELGSDQIVGYMDTIPDVTGTLEIMTHDWKLYRMLAGDTDTTEDDDFNPNELGRGNWGLLIQVWRRESARTASDHPEKSIYIPLLDITSVEDRSQVGQDVMFSVNWASRNNDLYVYRGRHPQITL